MPSPIRSFVLPDLEGMVPFQFSSNPHFKRAAAESAAWIDSFNIFRDRKRAEFIQSCTELLVSYGYPTADYEAFRTCCDFMNIIFLLDEVCDDQDGSDARTTADIFLLGLRDEREYNIESPFYSIVRQYVLFLLLNERSVTSACTRFRARFVKRASWQCQQRLWNLSESYLNSLAVEAHYKEQGVILDVGEFMTLRREVSAARICYGLFEYVHGVDLPDEVFDDQTFMNMYWAGIDMIGFANVRTINPITIQVVNG